MANIENARIKSYNVSIDGVDVGIVRTGLAITGEPSVVALEDVDQYFGRVAETQVGWAFQATGDLYEVQISHLMEIFGEDRFNKITSGGQNAYDFDTVPIDLVANSRQVVFHPTDLATSDMSQDIVFWKATMNMTLNFVGNRTQYQSMNFTITAYPDTTRTRTGFPFSATYARVGDLNLAASDPDYIGMVLSKKSIAPHIHISEFEITKGGSLQTEWHGAWITNTTTTAAVNEAGNVAAGDVAFDYDAKSSGVTFAGKYLLLGTEVVYCSADSGGTGTSGTLTVVRAACFSVAAGHLDDASITLLENPIVYRVTTAATLASSDATKATIGNLSTNKGIVVHVATGTSNLTAVIGGTTSKTGVVTAL
jgi:hypothetical protein